MAKRAKKTSTKRTPIGASAPASVGFKLDRIQVLDSRLIRPKKLTDLQPDNDPLHWVMKIGYGVTKDDRAVGIKLDLTTSINQTKEEFFWMTVVFFVLVSNNTGRGLREILENNQGLAAQMVSLAYSTMRGIVYEKGRGTPLEEHLLPTASPGDLIKGMQSAGETEVSTTIR